MSDLFDIGIEIEGLEALDELLEHAEALVIESAQGLAVELINRILPRMPVWSGDMQASFHLTKLGAPPPVYGETRFKVKPWLRLAQAPSEPYSLASPNWRALAQAQKTLSADLAKIPRQEWLKGVTLWNSQPMSAEVLTQRNLRDIRTSMAVPAAVTVVEFKYGVIEGPTLLALKNARLNVALPSPTAMRPFGLKQLERAKAKNKARQAAAQQKRARLAKTKAPRGLKLRKSFGVRVGRVIWVKRRR